MEDDTATSTERLSRVRALLIAELSRSAELHERGCYEDLGSQFDAIDELIWKLRPRRFRKTTLEYKAYCLLDSWLDSAGHDWLHHEPIRQADWPSLARKMVAVLEGKAAFCPEDYAGAI